MIAKELEIAFNQAVQEARKRRHDMVTLEHLLYAMLEDRYSIEILRAEFPFVATRCAHDQA